jgi:signal transduction histidine kinase
VFAFDEANTVQLVNAAGARLLARPLERLNGRSAAELGLAPFLEGEATGVRDAVFAGRAGRFGLRRGEFRQGGKPHRLLVLADLSRALRDEERMAWQRLVRVLGHEVNNSLAPIKSVAQSLQAKVRGDAETRSREGDDLERGLNLIAARSEALARLMGAYARLARLPAPKLAPLDVETWVRRVAGLETRLPVAVMMGPRTSIQADGDQLDQLLINLITNAVDAALQANGSFVEVTWSVENNHLDVAVRDDGPGLPTSGNLFVPFFTTKPSGSGIGLALSRQIAESHGGTLTLANRPDGQGCVATLRLPKSAS